MVRVIAAALLLSAAPAVAAGMGVAGRGVVRLLPGWHLSWDDPFQENARAAGIPLSYPREGGPGGFLGFGYGASEDLELGVDLYGAFRQYRITDDRPLNLGAYGLFMTARWIPIASSGAGLEAHVQVGMGPVLGNVTGNSRVAGESVSTGFLAGTGVSWNVAESWALSLEYRWVLARPLAPESVGGTVGAGGHFLLLGVSWHVAGQPPRRVTLDGF
jgi:opacity protein-like surface antigen